ncbi:peptidase U4 sporulation factor SpoIIGA [Desulfotomaculum nigrificans CO-1-SRB]|uniref:Sporulation sigma-E factor-processing peptidase n=1 Tax=Desulfotomaculum nigrificans (strain DSM 14880 / VKM B-2319 / CO-1-SRB) TaxID=868595 RepID=F6B3D4_DESCC|nr:sigma-E processing peptidase SpoIIGA [Desulfotomaculum nigrificans]AEF95165.1 peptidase U4 sporulation factor SpoIIGA [Desulfotomaculum nigrificans CO-1-SRB]
MKQVVYIDEIFIVNLVMNLTALWLTSRFSGNRTSSFRMTTAAAVGCIYAVSIFFPGWQMALHLGLKLSVAVVMLVITFGLISLKQLLKQMAYFLLASFAVGGVAVGLDYLLANTLIMQPDNQSVIGGFNKWTSLVLTVLIVFITGKWGAAMWFKRIQQASHKVPLTVSLWGKEVCVPALLDTGNQLTDPLSQRPVIIVEFDALQPALPDKIVEMFANQQAQDGSRMMLALADTPYAKRLRLIPFKSVGQENGMLLGIYPDVVVIRHGGKSHIYKDVVVGIYNHQLSPESTYKALLHPQLLAS